MELGHQTALAVLQSTHYDSVCMTMVGIFLDCLFVTIRIAHTCSDDYSTNNTCEIGEDDRKLASGA